MTPILLADISIYNWPKGIPYNMLPRLRKAGVKAVICRATIGTRRDPSFATSVTRLRGAGFLAGAYHFLEGGIKVADQVDAYASAVTAVGIDPLLTALDVERGGQPTYAEAEAFATGYDAAFPKHDLGYYSNRSTAAGFGNPDIGQPFDYLWQALYSVRGQHAPVNLPAKPPHGFGGLPTTIWQWGPLLIEGTNGTVRLDGNAFYGTLPELTALATSKVKPHKDRHPYVAAYNGFLNVAQKAVTSLPHLGPVAGPWTRAGYDDARADILDDLAGMDITPTPQ